MVKDLNFNENPFKIISLYKFKFIISPNAFKKMAAFSVLIAFSG